MTILKSALLVLSISLALSIYYINHLKHEVLSQKELMLYARVESLEYQNKVAEYKHALQYQVARAERAAADAIIAESKAKESEKIALRVLEDCNK
jgi:hypothetical protein